MSSPWPMVELGDVLTKSDDWIALSPDTKYQEVTVRLWGKGVVPRGEVSGAEIAAKSRLRVHADQFIFSRIDARNGALGVVPTSLDGAVVSSDFPVFNIDLNRLLPAFLSWMSKTGPFVDICHTASEGTTNRIRLKEDRFLKAAIPLPPLAEQRRIVAKIDTVAAKIQEARNLGQMAAAEITAMFESAVQTTFGCLEGMPTDRLANLTTKIGSGSTPLGGRASYPSEGIPFVRSLNVRMRSFEWNGIEFIRRSTHNAMSGTHVRPNDVLLNITGASIGRAACAPNDLVEANVNQHVAIIRPVGTLNSRFLMYWLSQPRVQEIINTEQKGATRQGFTKAQIEAFRIPVLSPDRQRRIVAYLDGLQAKVDTLKALQAQAAAEVDAMLPSILDRAFKGEL